MVKLSTDDSQMIFSSAIGGFKTDKTGRYLQAPRLGRDVPWHLVCLEMGGFLHDLLTWIRAFCSRENDDQPHTGNPPAQ